VINQATLTITASNRSKAYGDTVTSPGRVMVAGLVNADTITSVTLTSAGAAATAARGKPCYRTQCGYRHRLENYEIAYVDGTLTVNPKA